MQPRLIPPRGRSLWLRTHYSSHFSRTAARRSVRRIRPSRYASCQDSRRAERPISSRAWSRRNSTKVGSNPCSSSIVPEHRVRSPRAGRQIAAGRLYPGVRHRGTDRDQPSHLENSALTGASPWRQWVFCSHARPGPTLRTVHPCRIRALGESNTRAQCPRAVTLNCRLRN